MLRSSTSLHQVFLEAANTTIPDVEKTIYYRKLITILQKNEPSALHLPAAAYPKSFVPVKTIQKRKSKPLSSCPHLVFNVSRRGGPALWEGTLKHINTRLHLWGSEGKTLRPCYRG